MSVGMKIGRALGQGAALAVEGCVRGAQASGRFGTEIVAGAEAGYADKRAELLASRALAAQKREQAKLAFVAKQNAIGVAPAMPKKTATAAVR